MSNKKVIFFIGTAGSGKSYIAKQLAALVDADYISSGDIARALPDVQKDLAGGGLYHNDIPILNETFEFITNPRRSECTIVDGVPRNENQVHWLMHFSNTTEYDWLVVYVDAEMGTRMRRILARARDIHDGYETVVKRLSKDLIGMTRVYELCDQVFGDIRVLKLLSEKDGDATVEISAIMDRMHKFISSTEVTLLEDK
jgi:adenylate kinase family enzyme